MAKKDESPLLLMEDIDHTVCNVVFEYLVLTIYGNLLILSTPPYKFVAFSYLHVDVIDTMGTTTITVNIRGGLIKTHVEFIKKGCFLQLEIFSMKVKTYYDKGDSDWMIKLSTTTKVTTIPTFDHLEKLHFLPKDTIRNFFHLVF
jgi:hypothetical protein